MEKIERLLKSPKGFSERIKVFMVAFLLAIAVSIIFSICGCGSQLRWEPDRKIETEAERKAVADLEMEIIHTMLDPQTLTLSGDDQDIEDLPKETFETAHEIAVKTICPERLYEYVYYPAGGIREYTGRWKEYNKIEASNK